jgi:hypothetical protein
VVATAGVPLGGAAPPGVPLGGTVPPGVPLKVVVLPTISPETRVESELDVVLSDRGVAVTPVAVMSSQPTRTKAGTEKTTAVRSKDRNTDRFMFLLQDAGLCRFAH